LFLIRLIKSYDCFYETKLHNAIDHSMIKKTHLYFQTYKISYIHIEKWFERTTVDNSWQFWQQFEDGRKRVFSVYNAFYFYKGTNAIQEKINRYIRLHLCREKNFVQKKWISKMLHTLIDLWKRDCLINDRMLSYKMVYT